MQLLLEKFLFNSADLGAVQSPESTVPIGTQRDGRSFSDHLQTMPAIESAPAVVEPVNTVDGTTLPLDGNLLPATVVPTDGKQSMIPLTTDELAAEGLARGQGIGKLLRHAVVDDIMLTAGPTQTEGRNNGDRRLDGPVAAKRGRVAELQLDTGQVARGFDAAKTPPDGLVHASSVVSIALDKDRQPGSVSERATSLRELAGKTTSAAPRQSEQIELRNAGEIVRQDSDAHPPRRAERPLSRDVSGIHPTPPDFGKTPRSHSPDNAAVQAIPPAAELVQKIQEQRGFNKGVPAYISRDARFGRIADTGPVTDRESAVLEGFARSTAASGQNHRAELASQIVQELNALKVSTDTPGARMSSTIVSPPTQPVLGAVPAGGVNQSAAMPASGPAVTVNTPVFDPGWADALQDRIMWLVGRNVQAAEVRLNPAELGPVQIQISVDDNVAKIAFNATNAATREALEMALPRLKEMFAESGMTLDGASVSDQGVEDRREESDSLWQSDSAPDGDDSTQAVSAPLPDDRAVDEPAGLVDTYA